MKLLKEFIRDLKRDKISDMVWDKVGHDYWYTVHDILVTSVYNRIWRGVAENITWELE